MATKNDKIPTIIQALARPDRVSVHQYKATPKIKIPMAKIQSTILFVVKLFIPFIYE